MHDYWPGCGYRLLHTGPDGQLRVTDDFLRSLLPVSYTHLTLPTILRV